MFASLTHNFHRTSEGRTDSANQLNAIRAGNGNHLLRLLRPLPIGAAIGGHVGWERSNTIIGGSGSGGSGLGLAEVDGLTLAEGDHAAEGLALADGLIDELTDGD